ncbi:MAG: polysaccharide biosynthesis protein [Clostridiaceae bacterium]|nr:polysaccharide biosynthesis protein [Clostridiaceae bacterium]
MERQSLLKGTIILGVAGIMARFLGLFFRWPLIMLIGDEGVGYYQMSYPLYMFFIAMASGIPVAISKMVSEKNALNDREGLLLVFRKSLLLMSILGGGFSLFLFVNSKFLISFLKWDEKSLYALLAIAVAPIFISIMSVFRGFFQGMQNMKPTAISEIIEQLGRVIVGIGLAYILLPKGIEYSAGGAAFGAAAGGIFGGIYLFTRFIKIRRVLHIKKLQKDNNILSRLLYIAIPISLGATVGTVMSLIDSVIVPQKLLEAGFTYRQAAVLYGQLTGKAFVLINVPLTLSIALCASIVPVIAEQYILGKQEEVKNKIDMALKFSAVIALPSFCGLYFMAEPVFKLIFPGHSDGSALLKYLSISILFIVIAQCTTAILQATGKYIAPVINLSIGCIVKIVISYILVSIPEINIYGAIIGTIIGYMVASSLNILLLRRTQNIKINFYDIIIKPAFASFIMIIGVVFIYFYAYNITKSNGISCIISIFSGAIIYIILIIMSGVLEMKYIKKRILKQ